MSALPPEGAWAEAEAAGAAPRWRPLLLLAAHPDDETIGAGGLLARVRSAVLVHLTDGAPRDRRFWPAGLDATPDEYARLRRRELDRALQRAGVVRPLLLRFEAFDQEAAFSLADLTRRLAAVLAEQRPGVLLTQPYEGGHPDHDAAAFVAQAAVRRLRSAGGPAPVLLEMTSYHARGEQVESARFLQPRGREVVRLLTPAARLRKRRMLAAYESQQETLRGFPPDLERFRRAPAYDFTRPPAPEPLLYERWGFPITGRRWRELATEALRELELSP